MRAAGGVVGGAIEPRQALRGFSAMSDAGDTSFYKQVHRLIAARLSESRNRRDKQRRGYRCIQRLAPCPDGQLPNLAAFRDVECHDLSAGGFSFLADAAPACEMLAVELGQAPVLIYVLARIVHISENWSGAEKKILVGCRFTGRVAPTPSDQPGAAQPA
jgi:hypothetical protein